MKSIEGFYRYSVDENGFVYSHFFTSRSGRLIRRKEDKILSIAADAYGYGVVTLYSDTDKKVCKVHRLVASAFIENPEGKPQVNHKNGVKLDNRVKNLEWATSSENQQHSVDVLNRKTAKHWEGKENVRLQKPCVLLDKNNNLLSRWDSQSMLAKSGIMSKSSIDSKINTGRPVKGYFVYSLSYVKAWPAEVWREVYALEIL